MTVPERPQNEWRPQTDAERQMVRDQLAKLLASPHFLSSKRYPNLLRFLVEQTLDGREETLKERLLGVEVFHREPDYDTNQDPVVRRSAAEVRKRIALYYQQPAHQYELVIGLNAGSYIPFFQPAPGTPAPLEPPLPPMPIETKPPEAAGSPPSFWRFVVGILLVEAVALALGGYFYLRPSVTDQFWAPMLASNGRVTLCVGAPDTDASTTLNIPAPPSVYDELRRSGHLGTSSVSTLIRIGGALENRHKDFRLTLASETSFPELREGPVVLVGALDNAWTMRLTRSLRYGFVIDGAIMSIVDHTDPTRKWSVSFTQAPSSLAKDYAVIARYHDTTLDQPVVLAAGLSREGTEAAGQLLANPASLKALFQDASRNRKTVNLEAVVETQVIEGHPGPSRIVAIDYW
ncbi:MAG TPA: hypothetical protein VM554_14155 [Acidisarcina sp.]|nr:hypothetical protein [Acidisarcina sp.]